MSHKKHLNDHLFGSASGLGEQHLLFLQRMDTVGNATGSDDMNVDGSVTPVPFYIKPDPGNIIRLARVMLYVQDTGSFDAAAWGNGIVMANGMEVEMQIDGALYSMINGGDTIRTTGDVASVAYDATIVAAGLGDEYMVARWTFTKMGQFMRLDGDKGDFFRVTVNDDLTGINKQHIQAQGYYEKRA